MDRVFLLWHEPAAATDDAILIGVYSSEENARAAQSRLGDKRGFADEPEGFTIDPYVLDEDHWTEGFVLD